MDSTMTINNSDPLLYQQKHDQVNKYSPNLKFLPCNDQVRELQTILRDK